MSRHIHQLHIGRVQTTRIWLASFSLLLLCASVSSAIRFDGTITQVDLYNPSGVQYTELIAIAPATNGSVYIADYAYIYMIEVNGAVERLNTAIPAPMALALSAQQDRLFVLNGLTDTYVWAWETSGAAPGSPLARSPLPGASALLESRDGNSLYVSISADPDASPPREAHVVVVDAVTGEVAPTPLDAGNVLQRPRWMSLSKDGVTLYVFDENPTAGFGLFYIHISTGVVTPFVAKPAAADYSGLVLNQLSSGAFFITPDQVFLRRAVAAKRNTMRTLVDDVPPCSGPPKRNNAGKRVATSISRKHSLKSPTICSILSYLDFNSSTWTAVQTSGPQLLDSSVIALSPSGELVYILDTGYNHLFAINVTVID